MGRTRLILLDTHVVLWLALQPSKISTTAKAEIEQARSAGSVMMISDISLWEIASLLHRKRIQLDVELGTFLDGVHSRFAVRPITSRACVLLENLPDSYPRDPVDRIIGATALAEGIPLVTADERIRRTKAFATIW